MPGPTLWSQQCQAAAQASGSGWKAAQWKRTWEHWSTAAGHQPVHAQVAKKANGIIIVQPTNIYIHIHIEKDWLLLHFFFLHILYKNDTDVIIRKEKKKKVFFFLNLEEIHRPGLLLII